MSVLFRKIVCEFGPVRANIFFGRGFDLENFLLNNFLFDN